MAVSFDSIFGVDEDAATNGVWVKFGKAKVLIGFMGEANKNFVKAVETYSKPYKRDLDKGTLSNEEGKELLVNIITHGVVYNWDGFEEPYSKEACARELSKKNSLFLQEVQEMAKRLTTFRKDELEEDAGN